MTPQLLSSERSKWIFVIALVAMSAGLTANNVISFPTECAPGGAPDQLSPKL